MKKCGVWCLLVSLMMLMGCARPALYESNGNKDEKVITLLSFPDQDKFYLQAAIDAAQLDFQVEIIEVPQNQYEDKAKMMLMAQEATDLIMVDAPNIASYASSGMLEPLNMFWEKNDFADLTESMQETVQWQGKIWAAPLNDATCLLFYNKLIFEKAGIIPAHDMSDSWSLDELLENAVKLTKRNQKGEIIQYGLQPVMFTPDNLVEGMAFTQMLYLWWFGGSILDESMTRASGFFNSPESLDALKYFRSLYVTQQVAPLYEISNGFVDGKVAMWITGPWMLGTWRDNYPDFFQNGWGIMPLPHGIVEASPSGSWNIAMTAQSKHKQEAWQALEALTGRNGMKIWCEGTGNLPARSSVSKIADFALMQDAYELAMIQLQTTSRPRPVSPYYPGISRAIIDCFNSVAFGEEPSEAIKKATERIDLLLGSTDHSISTPEESP